MADQKKRIIDLSELSQEVQEGQYILVDSAGGTGKMNLKKIVDDSTTSLAERVTDLETGLTEEENARTAADTELSGGISNLQTALSEEKQVREDADEDIETALESKAGKDGYYPDLYAGNLSSTKKQTDTVPYLMRKTGGNLSRIGEREDDTLVGASVAENQCINANKVISEATSNGLTYRANGDGRVYMSGTTTGIASITNIGTSAEIVSGHVYYCSFSGFLSYTPGEVLMVAGWTQTFQYGRITKASANVSASNSLNLRFGSGITLAGKEYIPQLFDLTAMFGSTIADYIYSLESATAGAGIAKLREWGFLTGEYIPYNAGTLESVEARNHVMRGFNQWDEVWEVGGINSNTGADWATKDRIRSKNYVPAIPNTKYFITSPANVNVMFYNADKAFISALYFYPADNLPFTTPIDCYYIRFAEQTEYGTTYNHDICINLSSDRNGEYEPYSAQTYDLGTDTLHGLFKLDSNNQLYADGDVKTSDGVITRYYGTRAYQSGDESLADAITDGTTTVYKLATPTTETSTPFTSPQVCYPDGTEEYVTSNGVPVGHETEYDYDIKGLAEGLIDVPDVPSTNGTYVLKATRTADGLSYNWVAG